MLPRDSRLRTAADFAAVVKAGRRSGTRRIVVHAFVADVPDVPRAGFVVSGKVGNSVVRHRVTRRLRPLVRAQLLTLAPGTAIVIRALPAAAAATSAELEHDLHSGVSSAVRKATVPASRTSADRPSASSTARTDPKEAGAGSVPSGTRQGTAGPTKARKGGTP